MSKSKEEKGAAVRQLSDDEKLELKTEAGDLLKAPGGITSDITLTQRYSIFTKEMAKVKERDIGFTFEKQVVRCVDEPTIDIAGASTTNNDGKFTWRLNNFVCWEDEYGVPISFVATPHSQSPICLTIDIDYLSLPGDVVVKVFTWDLNGRPAPKIRFSWRCRTRRLIIVD